MVYIHNRQDPKVEEMITKECDPKRVKEVLMKCGYNCEDIDNRDEIEKQTMKEFEENVKKAAKLREEKYSIPYPILDEARKIITGNRKDDYGTAEDSFKRIADYWNAYLCHKRDRVDASAHEEDLPYEFLRGVYLTAKDVAMMMVLFKIAREEHSHKHDNLTDIIGYTALADKMEN